MPPNVFLIVCDTARADAFEPWGAPAGSTPAAADLASRGRAFSNVIAPSNWTLPSHASMFTGLLPGPLGLTNPPTAGRGLGSRPILEGNADRVLAEVLRRNGYATRAVSSNPFISPLAGFATGFEEFRSIAGGRRHRKPGFRSWARWIKRSWESAIDDGADEAEAIISRWIREHDGRPFFWFVNLMECHAPYLPPRPYNDLSSIGRLRAARDAARYLTPEGLYRICAGQLDVADDALGRMRHLYARSIRRMDDWLARMLERLAAERLLDDTYVVLTSDHGENIGENHLVGHAFSMDERLLRVPLVVTGPETPVDESLVSLADLPRMVAHALAIQDHPWGGDTKPHGFAVSQAAGVIMLPSQDAVAKKWETAGVSREAMRAVARPLTAATDGRHKLVRSLEGEALYDLEADPLEVRPTSPDGPEANGAPVATMRAAIDEVEQAKASPVSGTAPSTTDEETADLEERLRLLGYV